MLDADTHRTDLELRLISLSLKGRLIDLTACVAAGSTKTGNHLDMIRNFKTEGTSASVEPL